MCLRQKICVSKKKVVNYRKEKSKSQCEKKIQTDWNLFKNVVVKGKMVKTKKDLIAERTIKKTTKVEKIKERHAWMGNDDGSTL